MANGGRAHGGQEERFVFTINRTKPCCGRGVAPGEAVVVIAAVGAGEVSGGRRHVDDGCKPLIVDGHCPARDLSDAVKPSVALRLWQP